VQKEKPGMRNKKQERFTKKNRAKEIRPVTVIFQQKGPNDNRK
jgi:hypothetical protein